MTTLEFLSQLKQQNIIIKLTPEGDQLKISAPKGALSQQLKMQLKQRKAEIIAFLREAKAQQELKLPSIQLIERDSDLKLSFAQERIWKLHQLSPAATTMNVPFAWRLAGPIDAGLLERALGRLAERHETLRSRFPEIAGEARVIIDAHQPLKLAVVDLRESPAEARAGEALRVANTLAAKPFDISNGPVMRASLIRTAAERHILLLVLHQIIFDWGAARAVVQDIQAIYSALRQGNSPDLEPLPVQYVDFAHWQRDWLQGARLARQSAYWSEQLKKPYKPLALPADFPRPAIETFASSLQYFDISPELTTGLKTLSQKAGVTLYMTLLGALQALLASYSSQEEAIIFSFMGLNRPELKKLIGLFANPLPLRLDLSGKPTFVELLSRVQEMALDAYSNQDLPFEQVITRLNSEQRTAQRAFFQVLFIYQHEATPLLKLPGVDSRLLKIGQHAPAFDLRFFAEETESGLKGWLEYKTELFAPGTIESLLQYYVSFLAAAVERPDGPIEALLPLTPADKIAATDFAENYQPGKYVAPRTEVETRLASIWAQIFQLDSIGIHDNFFALGGHSLMAVDLFRAIKKELGRKLPLATLFAAPTVAELAPLLDKQDWSPQWSSLVPIQPDGSKRPLFCVSALGDEIIQFAELANLLGDDQPFYGLQQGLERSDTIRTTIPEIAAHYLKEIRAVQPRGPYLIAGYCFGGLVAYEMAQQLQAVGEMVEPLLLIEAEAPGGIYPVKSSAATKMKRGLRSLRDDGLREELRNIRKRLYKIGRRQIWTRLRHYLHKGYEQAGQQIPDKLKDILQINAQAAADYGRRIRPYAGDIYLLRAEQLTARFHYKEMLGWEELINGEIKTYWIPGDHEDIWKTPNVQSYALQLARILEHAEKLAQPRNRLSLPVR